MPGRDHGQVLGEIQIKVPFVSSTNCHGHGVNGCNICLRFVFSSLVLFFDCYLTILFYHPSTLPPGVFLSLSGLSSAAMLASIPKTQ